MDAPRGIGTFVVWDYVVFSCMLLISAAIGIYYAFAGGGQKTSTDFLMGGRSMTAVPVALSLTASFMSAVTILGSPSEVYRFGAMYSIFAITYFLVVVISAEIFLPVFYKLGITSTYEVKGRWAGRSARGWGAWGDSAGFWSSSPGDRHTHHQAISLAPHYNCLLWGKIPGCLSSITGETSKVNGVHQVMAF